MCHAHSIPTRKTKFCSSIHEQLCMLLHPRALDLISSTFGNHPSKKTDLGLAVPHPAVRRLLLMRSFRRRTMPSGTMLCAEGSQHFLQRKRLHRLYCHPLSDPPRRASVLFLLSLLLLRPEPCDAASSVSTGFLDEFLMRSTAPEFRLYTSRNVVFAGDKPRFVCMALVSGDTVLFQWLINNHTLFSGLQYDITDDTAQTIILISSRKLQMRYSVLHFLAAHPRHTGIVSCRVTLRRDEGVRQVYLLNSDFEVQARMNDDGTLNQYSPGHGDLDTFCDRSRRCVGENIRCVNMTQLTDNDHSVSLCRCSTDSYAHSELGMCIPRRNLGQVCYFRPQCKGKALTCSGDENICVCEAEYQNSTRGCISHASLNEFCDETHICTQGMTCIDALCTCPPEYFSDGRVCRKRFLSLERTRFLFKVVVVCGSIIFIFAMYCMLTIWKRNTYEPSLLNRPYPRSSSWAPTSVSLTTMPSLRNAASSRRKSLPSRSSAPESTSQRTSEL